MTLNHKVATKRNYYNQIEDGTLLTLIANEQDRTALAELYERYRQPVARFLLRGMREPRLIEEVYNDVMMTVWSKARSFRGDSKVSTWIFAIAYRQRMSHSRKESKHDHLGGSELSQALAPDQENSLLENLQAALVELSEPHRCVIELMYFHGYNTQEIAGIVKCPQNTVKTRLFHARKKLKATLQVAYDMLGGIYE